MRAQPIVYVTTMSHSTEWYSRLLQIEPSFRSHHWTTFDVGDATVALHSTDAAVGPGNVALSLVATESLEQVRSRIEPTTDIIHQPFGRSFTTTDPDGVLIQINEHMH